MHETNVTVERSQLIMSNNYKRNNFQSGRRVGRGGHQKRDQQNKLTFQPKKHFETKFKEENRKQIRSTRKKQRKAKNSRLNWEAKI